MKDCRLSSFRILSLVVLASAVAACAAPPPVPTPGRTNELAGQTAGQPARCIPIVRSEGLRVADPQTVVYGHGRTIWANRLSGSCAGLRQGDLLIVEAIGSRYCRGNLVRSVDPVSHVQGPACVLGDFVPYTR